MTSKKPFKRTFSSAVAQNKYNSKVFQFSPWTFEYLLQDYTEESLIPFGSELNNFDEEFSNTVKLWQRKFNRQESGKLNIQILKKILKLTQHKWNNQIIIDGLPFKLPNIGYMGEFNITNHWNHIINNEYWIKKTYNKRFKARKQFPIGIIITDSFSIASKKTRENLEHYHGDIPHFLIDPYARMIHQYADPYTVAMNWDNDSFIDQNYVYIKIINPVKKIKHASSILYEGLQESKIPLFKDNYITYEKTVMPQIEQCYAVFSIVELLCKEWCFKHEYRNILYDNNIVYGKLPQDYTQDIGSLFAMGQLDGGYGGLGYLKMIYDSRFLNRQQEISKLEDEGY